MSLTQYEKSRLQYLEYYEGYPENKGGLDESERVALFKLREKAKLGLPKNNEDRKLFRFDEK